MTRKCHVRFLGERWLVTVAAYPTCDTMSHNKLLQRIHPDATSGSARCSLPGHAFLVTERYEAPGTMYPQENL